MMLRNLFIAMDGTVTDDGSTSSGMFSTERDGQVFVGAYEVHGRRICVGISLDDWAALQAKGGWVGVTAEPLDAS